MSAEVQRSRLCRTVQQKTGHRCQFEPQSLNFLAVSHTSCIAGKVRSCCEIRSRSAKNQRFVKFIMPIIIVTGGARSGKSHFAEQIVQEQVLSPVYVATARVLDDEFAQRVRLHKERRDESWTNVEEELYISKIVVQPQSCILLDCITMWLTNIFFDNSEDIDCSLKFMKQEWDGFTAQYSHIVAVTNEIGLGVVPENRMSRSFVDLHGLANQYIAQKADSLYLMVSGVPLKIK